MLVVHMNLYCASYQDLCETILAQQAVLSFLKTCDSKNP